jgi:hypothetical protein
MNKRFSAFLYITAILQLLSAFFHSLSFFAEQKAANPTEQQLIDLMTTYQTDMGAGFTPSMFDLFTGLSSCFTMMYALGGWLLIYLTRKRVGVAVLKGIAGIYTIVFGVAFVIMYRFTFLPPIILTGVVFIACVGSYLSAPKQNLIK